MTEAEKAKGLAVANAALVENLKADFPLFISMYTGKSFDVGKVITGPVYLDGRRIPHPQLALLGEKP